jgi:hypothetical protein
VPCERSWVGGGHELWVESCFSYSDTFCSRMFCSVHPRPYSRVTPADNVTAVRRRRAWPQIKGVQQEMSALLPSKNKVQWSYLPPFQSCRSGPCSNMGSTGQSKVHAHMPHRGQIQYYRCRVNLHSGMVAAPASQLRVREEAPHAAAGSFSTHAAEVPSPPVITTAGHCRR